MKISREEARQIYADAITFLQREWPGCQPGQGCLYAKDGLAYVVNLDGIEDQDSQALNLYGATVSLIAGELTAVVDVSVWGSIQELTSVLVHELFHVHQMNHWKAQNFPNPEYLVTYPLIYENEVLRKVENQILTAFFRGERDRLGEWAALRVQRTALVGIDYMAYERSIETIEGVACYLEQRYLQSVNGGKLFSERIFADIELKELTSNQFRLQYLAKGALLAYAVDQLAGDWKTTLERDGESLSEILANHIETASTGVDFDVIPSDEYIKQQISQKHLDDEGVKQNFMNADHLVEIRFINPPDILKLDPMKMKNLSSEMIYHAACLQVADGGYFLNADGIELITSYADSIWKMTGLFLHFDNDTVEKHTIFDYDSEQLQIHWHVADISIDEKGRPIVYFG